MAHRLTVIMDSQPIEPYNGATKNTNPGGHCVAGER